MVQVFRGGNRKSGGGRRQTKKRTAHHGRVSQVVIDHLDHEAKGVVPGAPVTFVTGALPGELCEIQETDRQKHIAKARVRKVLNASAQRKTPFCPHFGLCGGCQTQFAAEDYLLSQKQAAIGQLLQRFIGIDAEHLPWQQPITAQHTAYRRKVRLAVDARKPSECRIGFRDTENQVFNLSDCQVATMAIQKLIAPLQEVLNRLNSIKHLGHVSLFEGCDAEHNERVYVTLRFTRSPDESDRQTLQRFGEQQGCDIFLDMGEKQREVLNGQSSLVRYSLPLPTGAPLMFKANPDDFVQVNPQINQQMVAQALAWLQLAPQDKVLDLFCGVGNFTLPLARSVSSVVGFEGIPEMVQMAQSNALDNGISNVRFISGDLNDPDILHKMTELNCNKVLLDPARAGASQAVEQLVKIAPERILYVSCNPATFGRDIAKLLAANYQLTKLSLIDMFPQTSHTEMMGLFSLV
ncbi:23S rRNA (uracil(1939)-C(5))-methyltransferase RlmD [Planctobacterium marinum]|uniref:23S rRNA (uracil(1939)-C(5))-methyltransferase RlmD n=1 Tax=Planctobacterium marinum TaxID=1631968 RepID=UPI001E33A035|nr:23S rRNA (uracil(1939)-C(5))-methyltransferase RlmD [Planctobacterium marinum]MCC2605252.1 23S rRNA (uracil(1939)-C(5))-methyltransferase RlmD [Planctobacterium marinum]